MIYSFISLPFCPDPDPQIYADPDPRRAKTCGSVSGSETLPKMRLSEKVREEEVSLYAPEDGQRNTPASQTSVSPHNQSV